MDPSTVNLPAGYQLESQPNSGSQSSLPAGYTVEGQTPPQPTQDWLARSLGQKTQTKLEQWLQPTQHSADQGVIGNIGTALSNIGAAGLNALTHPEQLVTSAVEQSPPAQAIHDLLSAYERVRGGSKPTDPDQHPVQSAAQTAESLIGTAGALGAPEAVAGEAPAAATATATDSSGGLLSRIKRALTNTPEEKANAKPYDPQAPTANASNGYQGNSQAVDIANGGTGDNPQVYQDQQLSQMSPTRAQQSIADTRVGQIQRAAKATGQARIINEFKGAATDLGVKPSDLDASRMTSIGDAGDYVGNLYQEEGARTYRQLDDVYKNVTGQDGNFQKLSQTVKKFDDALDEPTLTPEARKVLEDNRQVAKQQLDDFTEQADAAMQENGYKGARQAIGYANKRYSQGLSIKEVGRRFNSGLELGTDAVQGGNQPLGNALRAVSQDGQPRGHVLEQGFGYDRAQNIKGIVSDMRNQIANRVEATRAQRTANANLNQAASAAGKRVTQAQRGAQATVDAAKGRVATVRGNRAALVKYAVAPALGAGATAALFGIHKALSGE